MRKLIIIIHNNRIKKLQKQILIKKISQNAHKIFVGGMLL
jgi:hypothetical protein